MAKKEEDKKDTVVDLGSLNRTPQVKREPVTVTTAQGIQRTDY